MKPYIKIPSGKSLDMVFFFASLALLASRLKTERQVSFWIDARNAFFWLVKQSEAKKWILDSKSRIFKNALKSILSM